MDLSATCFAIFSSTVLSRILLHLVQSFLILLNHSLDSRVGPELQVHVQGVGVEQAGAFPYYWDHGGYLRFVKEREVHLYILALELA